MIVHDFELELVRKRLADSGLVEGEDYNVVSADWAIKDARETFATAFERDPDFRRAYVDNIAMLLHDHYGITDHEIRNRAGDDILKLIFEDQANANT